MTLIKEQKTFSLGHIGQSLMMESKFTIEIDELENISEGTACVGDTSAVPCFDFLLILKESEKNG